MTRVSATARRLAIVCSVLLAVTAAPARAQRVPLDSVRVNDTSLVYAFTLTNQTKVIGRVTRLTADSVRVVSPSVTVSIARSMVTAVSAYPASSLHDGVLWPENPHATRLLFSPTAIPLRKGEGYFADFWIFLASASVGVTDRFSLGGGMTLIPSGNIADNVFYALPKYAVIKRPTLNVAIGGLLASTPWSGSTRKSLGILYGVATKGTRESNLTLGAGWGYVGNSVSSKPVMTLGGQHRVSKRVALITENWFVPFESDAGGFATYGVRFLGEKMAVDLAFGNVVGAGNHFIFPGIPLLGFAFKF